MNTGAVNIPGSVEPKAEPLKQRLFKLQELRLDIPKIELVRDWSNPRAVVVSVPKIALSPDAGR